MWSKWAKEKIESAKLGENFLETIGNAVAPQGRRDDNGEDEDEDEYYEEGEYEEEEDDDPLPMSPFGFVGRLTQALAPDPDPEEYEGIDDSQGGEYVDLMSPNRDGGVNASEDLLQQPASLLQYTASGSTAASFQTSPQKQPVQDDWGGDFTAPAVSSEHHRKLAPSGTDLKESGTQMKIDNAHELQAVQAAKQQEERDEAKRQQEAARKLQLEQQQAEALRRQKELEKQLNLQKEQEEKIRQQQRQEEETRRQHELQRQKEDATRRQQEEELRLKRDQEMQAKKQREEELKRKKEELLQKQRREQELILKQQKEEATRQQQQKEAMRQQKEQEMKAQEQQAAELKRQEELRQKRLVEERRQQESQAKIATPQQQPRKLATPQQQQQRTPVQNGAPAAPEAQPASPKASPVKKLASGSSASQQKTPQQTSPRPAQLQQKASSGSSSTAGSGQKLATSPMRIQTTTSQSSTNSQTRSQPEQKNQSPQPDPKHQHIITEQQQQRQKWEAKYKAMEEELAKSRQQVFEMVQQIHAKEQQAIEDQQNQMIQFQQKEARLLDAQAEDHQIEMNGLQEELIKQMQQMQESHQQELDQALYQQRREMEQLLKEEKSRADKAHKEKEQAVSQFERGSSQQQQQQIMMLRRTEDQLAQSLAQLDERDEEIQRLKKMVAELQSSMKEHKADTREAEEELDELHSENQTLRGHAEKLGNECARLKAQVEQLEQDSEKLSGMKLELQMLREKHARENSQIKQKAASVENTQSQTERERDEAILELHALRQQVTAAEADLAIARSDAERIMLANENLQSALEAFQNEREAELGMVEEQRLESEGHLKAAHDAAMEATKEMHRAQIREVQAAADAEVRSIMAKVQQWENTAEEYRLDNVQMRRSLDQAIQRLQATQEDVIDRQVIKNILLDWLTKTDAHQKRQVLDLMASLLYFTDEEKSRVHIQEGSELMERVVHAVAVPLPPTKVDMEHLEGENVREMGQFFNGETDDG